MERSIEVTAEWVNMATLMAFADGVESSLSLTAEQSFLMRLVIEEIATNVIKYGYDERRRGPISVTCRYDQGALSVIVRDRGQPFDPRNAPPPDIEAGLAGATVGGLGIFLVREFADEIQYYYDAEFGWNVLMVTKHGEH